MRKMLMLIDYGAYNRARHRDGKFSELAKKATPKPWVAEKINGELMFVRGYTDYRDSDSLGRKNVTITYFLEIGKVYLVCEPDLRGRKNIREIVA